VADSNEVVQGSPPPQAPGGLLALGPGGSFGAQRRSIVEVKAAVSSLVVSLEPGTILLRDGTVTALAEYDHVTIHRDLMVHLQGRTVKPIQLTPPAVIGTDLVDDAIHLLTITAAPSGVVEPYARRSQRRYEGGVSILAFVPDAHYHPRRSHLLVDVWASRPWFEAPGWLPTLRSATRIALSFDGRAALGPIAPQWAFRSGDVPPCHIHFRFWYEDLDITAGVPAIIPGGSCFRIEGQSGN
jgi:hypothetical protein